MNREYGVMLNPRVKLPIVAFKVCPCCESNNLLPIETDVFCRDCDWNSLEAFADAGGLDWWDDPDREGRMVM